MVYKLYKLSANSEIDKSSQYLVKKFNPNFFRLSINPSEKPSFKTKLMRIYFYIITKGNFEIYFVENNREIVHTSYVLGNCFKFKFMKKNDIEIGPCYTNKEYRGKGIYPEVLRTICYERKSLITNIYIFVDENNISSIKGIEKSNFDFDGNLKKGMLGTYQKSV